jgi:hypothetical protein
MSDMSERKDDDERKKVVGVGRKVGRGGSGKPSKQEEDNER